MLKLIKPIIIDKIWGYEKWVYSSLKGNQTTFENGIKTTKGPLIKIIKTKQPLSVQVHPNDKLAGELESMPNGKHESWYIIEANNKSELILGMKNYDKNFIINNIQSESFLKNLNIYKPKAGNFYDIPAGYVHGLGSNITVLEVQQPSNITYRYYDYNRKSNGVKRELHIEKAIKSQKDLTHVIEPINDDPLTYKNKYFTQKFCNGINSVKKDSIIINLKNHNTYFVIKDIDVDFENYAIVEWK